MRKHGLEVPMKFTRDKELITKKRKEADPIVDIDLDDNVKVDNFHRYNLTYFMGIYY